MFVWPIEFHDFTITVMYHCHLLIKPLHSIHCTLLQKYNVLPINGYPLVARAVSCLSPAKVFEF